MASTQGTSVFGRFRVFVRAGLGRVIRRGFFRITFLLFLLLFVIPFAILQLLGNRDSGNAIMREVVGVVFNTSVANVSWDEDATTFTGPSIALTGSITYHNLKVTRRAGETAHPRGTPLQYDFIQIPKVQIDYDLKRLPELPVTAVKIENGLTLYFNIHKGEWLDSDMFKSGEGGGEVPSLPEIITQGVCDVKLRADGILVPPETLSAGGDWFDMKVHGLSLLPNPTVSDQFVIGGGLESAQFGSFALGGAIERRAQQVNVLFRTVKPIQVNRAYAAVLSKDVRDAVEQFQITARTSIKEARLEIQPGKEIQFSADISAEQGSMCFVGFPLGVQDVTADIKVRNNNILVDAIGRRGAADVRVVAKVDAVGTNNELLQVNVDVRNLLVDEKFRLALLPARLQPDNVDQWTGVPVPEEEFDPLKDIYFDDAKQRFVDGFPDWQGPAPWRGGSLYPEIDPVLPFICRAFTPMGLADFQLRLDQEMKGRDPVTGKSNLAQTMNWKVFVHDATAAYVGLPEEAGAAFPVPLHNAYGVVEGNTSPGNPGSYVVRGYTNEELEMLGLEAADGFQAWDKRGMTGTLGSESERLWVFVTYQETLDPGQKATLKLNFESDGLEFDGDMKSRLPEGVRDVIAQFAPLGKVDIQTARVTVQPTGDADLIYDFTLSAKNVVAQYQFPNADQPVKFREVAGTIRIESGDDRVQLSNLRGKVLGSSVMVNIAYRDGDVPSFSVESDDFQLRPDFTSILPRGIGETLQRFEPRGYVKFEVAGRRGGSEPDYTDVDVTFNAGTGDRAGSISFDRFPYMVTNVTGRLVVHVTEDWAEIIIRDFSGRGSELPGQTDPSRITVNGQVLVPIPPDAAVAEGETPESETPTEAEILPIVDLRIEATRIPLDSAMLAAFTKMLQKEGDTAKPGLVEFAEKLNMGGTLGTSGRLVTDAYGEMDWQFEIMLEGASVNFENFKYPIDGLFGSVIVDYGEVRLRNVEGRAEEGTITIHNASYSDVEGWNITASGRDLNFASQKLRSAMPAGLRDVLRKLNPIGTFDIDLELGGLDDYMHYEVSLDTQKTDIELGLHFDDMTARFDFEGVLEGDERRENGKVFMSELFFKDARFNDITTVVQYFGDRVEFPNLRGRFYDGWLEGRFGMIGDKYAGEIEIRGADIEQLGKTAFPDAGELLGALDAEVVFYSDPDKDGQIGRGRVDIQPFDRDSPDPRRNTAKLLAVPLFSEIASVTGSESNFDEGHVFFWLGSDRITIREMDFVSNAARVETFGTDDENYIMYDTSRMKMKLFFTLAPRSPVSVPVVQWVLDKLKQILFPLFITGTLNSPAVQPFSLTAEELEGDEFPRRPRGP